MKFQLREKDYLEKHHLRGLIYNFIEKHNGEQPEYVIVHPETWHKIIMCSNENNADFMYNVIRFDYTKEKQEVTIYGVSFIRSTDIEQDFVIVT